MPESTNDTAARGTVRVDSFCSCGARWMIESDGSEPVGSLDKLIWGYHGIDNERHRGVSAEECRRERNRRAAVP